MMYLAADRPFLLVGYLIVPITGVILVILGVAFKIRASNVDKRMRSYPPQPMWPPPYPPPPYPPPQGWQPPPYQAPPPGYYGAPPYPAPIPLKSPHGRTGTVLLVIGGLILGGTVISAVGRSGRPGSSVDDLSTSRSVGQCFTDTTAFKGDSAPGDCSDPNAVFEVASSGRSAECPDGKSGEDSQYASVSDGDTTYCILLNLQQGRCYAVDSANKTVKLDDCLAHRSAQVTRRVDGSTDVSVCGGAAKTAVFPEPPRVYCLDKS